MCGGGFLVEEFRIGGKEKKSKIKMQKAKLQIKI